MENITLLLNGSDAEFPFWQLTAAIDLSGYLFVTCIAIFILNFPLLVAFFKIKKKQLTAINTLHMSLLIASIIEDILRAVARSWYVPNIYRFCYCGEGGYIMTIVVLVFFIFYRCSMFACLSVIQFLIIFGKKKWANLKVSFGMILLSVGIGILAIAASIRDIHGSRERVSCFNAYCPGHRPESGISNLIKVVFGVTLGAYLPSTALVIIMSTWSCAIFKKYYTGGDDSLNRRMLSLPFIMPLANLTSTVLEALSVEIISAILLNLPLGVFFNRWILFTQALALILLRFINRLTYPLVLVYTHIELRRSVKTLLKPGGNNSVTPKTTGNNSSDK